MQIPVLIERFEGKSYHARSGEPLTLTAEGATQEEVLQNLRQQIESRVAAGAQFVALEIQATPHPRWTRFVGRWKPDDPLIEEWEKEVAEFRRKLDEDPDVL